MAENEAKSSKSPFNVWWFAAAAFLVLVLVGAVFLGFRLGQSGEEDPSAGEGDAPASQPAPEEEEPAAGECGALSDDQSYPTEAPPTEWESYGSSSMTVPVSEEFGPAQRDGELWECYSHSPTGAVYAGLGLIASFSVGGQYEAAVDSPEAQSAFESEQAGAGASFPSFSGFRIDEYTEDSARVTYYGQQDQYRVGIAFSLTWDTEVDDWRLDWSRPDGFEEDPPEDQFVMWER